MPGANGWDQVGEIGPREEGHLQTAGLTANPAFLQLLEGFGRVIFQLGFQDRAACMRGNPKSSRITSWRAGPL